MTHILKKKKIKIKKNKFLQKKLIEPTKIYVKEILNLNKHNLIHSSANITGGGIIENIPRSIPNGYTANIDLSKIKVLKVFKWLKSKNVSDMEMLRTFNCGVGFCLVIDPYKLNKVTKFFSKKYKPYIIGKITKKKVKVKLNGKISWFK